MPPATTPDLDRETVVKSCAPKQKRLTALDIGWLLKSHKEGMTEKEIAQRLGVTQQAVSKWVLSTTDTTNTAKLFLRGNALRMAQNIVRKGRAADHIKALEGINVLAPEQTGGIVVQIGIRADSMTLLSPPQPNKAGEGAQNP